jgi:hypothetical protein
MDEIELGREIDREEREYEQDWEDFWKDIIIDENKNINLDQVKRELSDYGQLIENTCEIVCEITGNRLSYPNYPARTVLDLFEDQFIDKQIAGEDMIRLVKDSKNLEEIMNEMRIYFGISKEDFEKYTA